MQPRYLHSNTSNAVDFTISCALFNMTGMPEQCCQMAEDNCVLSNIYVHLYYTNWESILFTIGPKIPHTVMFSKENCILCCASHQGLENIDPTENRYSSGQSLTNVDARVTTADELVQPLLVPLQ